MRIGHLSHRGLPLVLSLAAPARLRSRRPGGRPSASVPESAALRGVPRSQRADMWYARRFGVDQMRVRYTASGASVEFRSD